jgi:HTH-type transcriptional regulator/antitoxin HigA
MKVGAVDIAPIKTQRDYHNTLKEIEGLMTAKRNTPEGDRLDALVTLVEAWERKHKSSFLRTTFLKKHVEL